MTLNHQNAKIVQLFRFGHNRLTFSAANALLIALIGGAILTALITIARWDNNFRLDPSFHFVYSLSINTIIIFAVLFYNFYIFKSSRLTRKTLAAMVGSLLITIVLSLLSGFLHQLIYDDTLLSEAINVNILRDILIAFVAVLIALLLYNLTRRLQSSIEREQLQAENITMRYEALEKQLDPHFLFNSLNTLSGLIGNDDERAQSYLQQLSSTYRYIMQVKRLVTLEQELKFVDSYCQMMQIRYGQNLTFEYHIDERFKQYEIIPISLQLLIENALKHNVVSDRHPLNVVIATTADSTITVSNIIQPRQAEENSTGLGLVNLSKRYQLLCQKEINITQCDDLFTVEVPLLDSTAANRINNKILKNNLS